MSQSDPIPSTGKSGTTLVALAIIGAVFVTGVLVGVAADRMIIMHRGARGPGEHISNVVMARMLDRLDRELDLSPSQRADVDRIMRRHHARIQEVWSNVRPQVGQEIEQANREIDQLLNEKQKARFKEIRLRFETGRHFR